MCLTPTQRSDIFRNVAYSLPTISHTPSFRPSLIPCPYSSHFAIAVVCTNKMLNCRKSRMNSLSLVESLCTHPIPHISLSGTLCMLLPPPFREKSLHATCSSPWHPACAPVWPNEATIHIMKTIFQSLFLSSLSIYLTLFLLPPHLSLPLSLSLSFLPFGWRRFEQKHEEYVSLRAVENQNKSNICSDFVNYGDFF